MKSIGFDFFATKEDLMSGIQAFEADHRVQYVLWGLFESPTFERYSSATEIPGLGRSIYGHRGEKCFLVIPQDAELCIEAVPQRDGSTRYSVDLMNNFFGFAFKPGGVHEDRFIIDGSVGTRTGSQESINLCKDFIRKLRRGFTRIQSYYVGPQALRLMDEGYRLTPSIQTPESLDLRRP